MVIALSAFIASLEKHPLVVQSVSALLALFIGFLIGRLAGLLLRTLLHSFGVDQHVRAATGHSFFLERNLSTLLSVCVYVASVIVALEFLNLTSIVLLVIAGVAAVIVLVSFLLALKDFLPNVFAAFIIRTKRPFWKGSMIAVRGVKGTVLRLTLTSVQLREGDDVVRVPNRLFLSEEYAVKKR
ncbi:mechanosensitive ion channel [Candidatus Woesearchaeota archaeon]|nr:mechanosensitive ion channel [Candidatus Woesearchaeota archaeon]